MPPAIGEVFERLIEDLAGGVFLTTPHEAFGGSRVWPLARGWVGTLGPLSRIPADAFAELENT